MVYLNGQQYCQLGKISLSLRTISAHGNVTEVLECTSPQSFTATWPSDVADKVTPGVKVQIGDCECVAYTRRNKGEYTKVFFAPIIK